MVGFVKYVLVAVEVVTSLLLIAVILLQRTKSQGMGPALGGAVGETLFGARMGNVLTRTTVVLGIVFLVNTTLLALIGPGRRAASSVIETEPAVPVRTAPVTPYAPAPSPRPQPAPAATEFDGTMMPEPGDVSLPAPAESPVEPVTETE